MNSQVDLFIMPDFLWKDRFHGAAERWWILVEVKIFFFHHNLSE